METVRSDVCGKVAQPPLSYPPTSGPNWKKEEIEPGLRNGSLCALCWEKLQLSGQSGIAYAVLWRFLSGERQLTTGTLDQT